MSSEITVIALLYPKAGKADDVIKGLEKMAEHVKGNEPGTLAYSINQELNKEVPTVVMIEKYKDQAALQTHASSAALKAFTKDATEAGLLEKPMQLTLVKTVGGFTSKL